ncbi:MAG: ABC transporter ATP-binding protein [Bacillota bacterium]|nr:ABC transporter ATP-binding protein [Bacillota bacterium]
MRIELNNLSCGYDRQKPIVFGVDMTLNSGDVCCMLGPNGVGKTTLFKTVINLLPPLSGQVSIDGQNIRRWNPQQVSRYLAYVAQAHAPVFPYLVKEVAMMGRLGQINSLRQPSRDDHDIVEQALEDVGLRHLRDAPYSQISGGERQLLMIARALCQQPQLLMLDEPTANLDYGNMLLVMKTLRRLADKGMCIIFTTHMPDQAFMCEAKTIMLRRGQAALFGNAAQVITSRNLYEAYQAEIQILEIISADGIPLKVIVPRLREERRENNSGKDI